MNAEALYLRLPTFLQNAACSMAGWQIQRTRFDSRYRRVLQHSEERFRWPEERIIEFRDQRLQRFLKHATETVPHYKELFAQSGLTWRDFHTLEDLQQLPILTKAEIQDDPMRFMSSAVPERSRVHDHTSGTTGAGLRFVTTNDCIREQFAIWWRYRRMHGLMGPLWCGYFGGRSVVPLSQERPPFWRYNWPGKEIFFSAYHLSRETFRAYVDQLQRRRPLWLHGYPSFLSLLAGFMQDAGVQLDYQPRWITTGAENLLPHQVTLIEAAFGCRPLQHYGTREAVANISQHPDGNLYVDEDFSAVEFLPTNVAGAYRIVGTNLANLAMPMIRYDVGDIAHLDSQPDASRVRRVVGIDGRKEDYVVLKNGSRLGRLDHIFKDMVAVREAQIYQELPGVVEIRIVRAASWTATDQHTLMEEAQKRMGADTDITLTYVDELPRTAAGKLRFVISAIDESQIAPVAPATVYQ